MKVIRVSVPVGATVRAEVVVMMADAMTVRDAQRWIMQGAIERELPVSRFGKYWTELSNAC
jgi:hypothetical protein